MTDAEIALVTGASSGIGRASALALARSGRRVFAGLRDPAKGADMARTAAAEGLALEVIRLDVTEADHVAEALGRIRAQAGEVAILVNNAGIGGAAPVEQLDEAVHRAVFDVNYFGAVRMIQAVLPAMRAQRSGTIVNVSSLTGRFPTPIIAHYSASKCALEATTEILAHEVAAFGVRVCNVEPGYVATELIANSRPRVQVDRESPYLPIIRRNIRYNKAVMHIALSPEAVADAIVRLVDSSDPPFRTVLGEDATRMIAGRAAMTDEEWIAFGAIASEADYDARFQAAFGIDLAEKAAG
jgi:NAD(P)-dependent dehydrogenase (short-subunit alcohol dehydrogenase family)